MGNSCSNHPGNHGSHPVHPTSGNTSAIHRRPASSVASSGSRSGKSGNRSGNPGMPSSRVIILTKIQTVHTEEQQIPSVTNTASTNQTEEPHTPCKSQKLPIEDQQIAPVITAATANQTDEPHTSCKSPKVPNEDQQIATVTTAVTANQTDEPHTFCKSPKVPNEDQQTAPVTTVANANQADEDELEDIIATSCCKFEADDASKELEKTSTVVDDYEDECPTCLEGYDEENPKIMTECNHHYHLACIFEWMERSDTCPVCNKVMIFNN